ncbi:unnamed protein product, partial [Trypanosoma congolense IL3000]
MFRFTRQRLEKASFAALFSYSSVLQNVFSAPAGKEALVVEIPGFEPKRYSYGRLRKDVLAVSGVIARRQELIEKECGRTSYNWLQQPRPDDVRSVFSNEAGSGLLSCDVLKDDGSHNMAIMASADYTFVVSLLAVWSLNQMGVPMSVSHKYDEELSYVIGHSRSRAVLGDTRLLEEKLPQCYREVLVRGLDSQRWPTPGAMTQPAYDVATVFDVRWILDCIKGQREMSDDSSAFLKPEHLPAAGVRDTMRNAQDVMDRLDAEKSADAERRQARRQSLMYEQFKESSAVTGISGDGDDDGMYYDTEDLRLLNPVHRRWVEDPRSRPGRNDDCLMLYTSGTTAKPKGVVHTHATVRNMISVLQNVWQWSSDDTILHMLPLHHIHGLVNILLCSLASGARCVLTKFDDPIRIAHRLERGDITLVMGVPTLYTKMTAAINQKMSPIEKKGFKNAMMQAVRLVVSGSSALPTPILQAFHEISGHVILERYGMTEIGMALGQPLHPVSSRVPGTVGAPLPTVRTFVHNKEGATVDEKKTDEAQGENAGPREHEKIGRLAISSQSLFDRYWANPTATKKDLVVNESGQRFFDTGDTVGVKKLHDGPNGECFTILGRTSVDIIKSSGFKLSALEIEAALLGCPYIFYEIPVVGCHHDVKGE